MTRGFTTPLLAALVVVPLLLAGCASSSIPDGGDAQSATPSPDASDTTDSGTRPTADEVDGAIQDLLAAYGSSLPADQSLCMGEELVASDLSDAELQNLIDGIDLSTLDESAEALSTAMATAAATCGVDASQPTADADPGTPGATPGAGGDDCEAIYGAYYDYASDFTSGLFTLLENPKEGYAELSDAQDAFASVVSAAADSEAKTEGERVLDLGSATLSDLEPIKDKDSTSSLSSDEWDIVLDATDSATEIASADFYSLCY